ncbi:MAG: hypothetical protein ACTSRA_02420 [Promethearchaeota archaeon]
MVYKNMSEMDGWMDGLLDGIGVFLDVDGLILAGNGCKIECTWDSIMNFYSLYCLESRIGMGCVRVCL